MYLRANFNFKLYNSIKNVELKTSFYQKMAEAKKMRLNAF